MWLFCMTKWRGVIVVQFPEENVCRSRYDAEETEWIFFTYSFHYLGTIFCQLRTRHNTSSGANWRRPRSSSWQCGGVYECILTDTVLESFAGFGNQVRFGTTFREMSQSDNRPSGILNTARLSGLRARVTDPNLAC